MPFAAGKEAEESKMFLLEFTQNLAAALALGALVGVERQWRQRMAGLRTNVLVSVGTAIFVLTVKTLPDAQGTARMAAQVASGIGFLGAGVIMRDGLNIRGLNTAATLWCSAGVGILCGMGLVPEALVGSLFVLGTNIFLRPVAQKLNRANANAAEEEVVYRVRVLCREGKEGMLRSLILQTGVRSQMTLRGLNSALENSQILLEVEFESTGRKDDLLEQMVSRFALERGVLSASWVKSLAA
jgi:putative Mg2+ transporter-C (MgtC) family protein